MGRTGAVTTNYKYIIFPRLPTLGVWNPIQGSARQRRLPPPSWKLGLESETGDHTPRWRQLSAWAVSEILICDHSGKLSDSRLRDCITSSLRIQLWPFLAQTLDKLLNWLEPQFPHLQQYFLYRVIGGVVNDIKQCKAHFYIIIVVAVIVIGSLAQMLIRDLQYREL